MFKKIAKELTMALIFDFVGTGGFATAVESIRIFSMLNED